MKAAKILKLLKNKKFTETIPQDEMAKILGILAMAQMLYNIPAKEKGDAIVEKLAKLECFKAYKKSKK